MRTFLGLAGLLLVSFSPAASAQGGAMFDKVVAVLGRRFHDRDFRRERLPALAERFADAAHATDTLDEERVVVHAFLKEIPASHLALYSRSSYQLLLSDVFASAKVRFGVQLVQRAGRFHACSVLHGGPAATAGVREGDRVLAVDGEHPGRSRRLDWRTDDAHLEDPPVHCLLAGDDPEMSLAIERDGRRRDVVLRARSMSIADASKASVSVVDRGGQRFGYLRLWTVFNGSSQLLRRALRDDFAACRGIVLDLRGRGGNGAEAVAIVQVLKRHARRDGPPIVAIIDRGTRSAKEIIASGIAQGGLATLLGQPTAGAVIPATFERVGKDSVLMYPAFDLGRYTQDLESVGVAPDVEVEDGRSMIERAIGTLARAERP